MEFIEFIKAWLNDNSIIVLVAGVLSSFLSLIIAFFKSKTKIIEKRADFNPNDYVVVIHQLNLVLPLASVEVKEVSNLTDKEKNSLIKGI